MRGITAKPGREKKPTTSVQKASIPNTGDGSAQKKAQLDAFWADALESDSILFWIVTHLPNPEQSHFL